MTAPQRPPRATAVRRSSWRRLVPGAIAAGVVGAASCTPIEPRPLSDAPMNSCPEAHPCERYERGSSSVGARCVAGRCLVRTGGDRPEFPFWIVVHVPDTSIYAPGSTFVLFSDERGEPAFARPPPGVTSRCSSLQTPPCIQVGGISSVQGEYKVTRQASIDVGHPFPLPENTSIPVRVVYEPKGNVQRPEFEPTLPLDLLFDSSVIFDDPARDDDRPVPKHARTLPFGTYLRVMYPQPPFDEFFPPTADIQEIRGVNHVDSFLLGAAPPVGKFLDDLGGTSRDATITRGDGLDGWRVWLEDIPTKRRISVVRKLSGRAVTVRLHTTGENRGSGGGPSLGDDVQAVVAPPDDWIAVPRFVTRLIGGAGLENLRYPALPPPVTVTGVVAHPGEGVTLLGIPARITFDSDKLLTLSDQPSFVTYSTTVETDDRGRFATVLPPGTYLATIEPAEGTGYAKARQPVAVDRTVTALTLLSPKRTLVHGRAVLTDERPLSEAEVIALPDEPEGPQTPKPRPGRTTTLSDGQFVLELDPGPYILSVVPKAGTGFPRVVRRTDVPATPTELPDIRVPAPIRLAFRLRDPSPTANPIVRAVVRIFAALPGRESRPVEIGSAMTDQEGLVEILLAQEPR